VPRCHYTYTDAADAVKAWNRRAKAADQVARVQALYDCMDPKGFFARKIKAILEENVVYPHLIVDESDSPTVFYGFSGVN
jgi:hypothetical protein